LLPTCTGPTSSSATTVPGFIGNIRDVDINYGQLPAMDTVTISGEGIQADWGRAQLNSLTLVPENIEEQLIDIGDAAGLALTQFDIRSTASAQTFTGNAFDAVNALVRTEEARMFAVAYQSNVTWPGTWYLWVRGRGANVDLNTKWEFNDGTITTSIYRPEIRQPRISLKRGQLLQPGHDPARICGVTNCDSVSNAHLRMGKKHPGLLNRPGS
jgi:hypothetical protein